MSEYLCQSAGICPSWFEMKADYIDTFACAGCAVSHTRSYWMSQQPDAVSSLLEILFLPEKDSPRSPNWQHKHFSISTYFITTSSSIVQL